MENAIQQLISSARNVRKAGDAAGIGSAANDQHYVVYVDFSDPPKTGYRETGISLPANHCLRSGQVIVQTATTVPFSLYLDAPANEIVAVPASAAGTILQVTPRILLATGGKVILTSAAVVPAGQVLVLLEIFPLI